MAASAEPRVALYFDFDNIVISRYDQLHGDGAYRKDTGRRATPTPRTAERLTEATVDIDAVLDFAATFGTIALARAYADWSTPVNASYRGQLIDRAVDLVQLFPLSATKNGADIRLAVDAVEDLFRLDDLTHLVIVAGDSDYVALAQKAKRLGRYVVGIGVAGGTSRALTASCDEYADYDALLTLTAGDLDADADPVAASIADSVTDAVSREWAAAPTAPTAPAKTATAGKAAGQDVQASADADAEVASPGEPGEDAGEPAAPAKRRRRATLSGRASESAAAAGEEPSATASASPVPEREDETDDASGPAASGAGTRNPGRLLLKALELLRAKNDQDWQPSGAVKSQMLRMDPGFQERALGFASFTDFLKSRGGVVELDESEQNRVRVRPPKR